MFFAWWGGVRGADNKQSAEWVRWAPSCDGENVKIQFADCVCMESTIFHPHSCENSSILSSQKRFRMEMFARHERRIRKAMKISPFCRLKVLWDELLRWKGKCAESIRATLVKAFGRVGEVLREFVFALLSSLLSSCFHHAPLAKVWVDDETQTNPSANQTRKEKL